MERVASHDVQRFYLSGFNRINYLKQIFAGSFRNSGTPGRAACGGGMLIGSIAGQVFGADAHIQHSLRIVFLVERIYPGSCLSNGSGQQGQINRSGDGVFAVDRTDDISTINHRCTSSGADESSSRAELIFMDTCDFSDTRKRKCLKRCLQLFHIGDSVCRNNAYSQYRLVKAGDKPGFGAGATLQGRVGKLV